MNQYTSKPLTPATWPQFEQVVEDHNGIWGGCWCMWYHENGSDGTPESRKQAKRCLVEEGRTHASLVFLDEVCVGWCQFGSPDELPRIHNKKAYLATDPALPDWRITCFFVAKGYRRTGVAATALEGAVQQIKQLGGGRIEAYPEDTDGRKPSANFLFNGTVALFERHGFKRDRKIGKHKWVVNRTVRKSRQI